MNRQLKLSLLMQADASSLKREGAEGRAAIDGIGASAGAAAPKAEALAAANDEIAQSARRVVEVLQGQSQAELKLADAINRRLGIAGRAAQVGDPFAGDARRAADVAAYGQALDGLRARWNPLFAEIQRYRTAQAEIRQAHAVGAIGADEMAAAIGRERQAALSAIAAIKGRTQALREANAVAAAGGGRFETANIAAQFQDIGVTAAMGMNPLQIGLQQGTQLSAILQTMESPAKGILAALTQVLNPLSLVTIGIIAAGSALVQYFTLGRDGVASLDEAFQRHAETLERIDETYAGFSARLIRYRDDAALLGAAARENLAVMEASSRKASEAFALSFGYIGALGGPGGPMGFRVDTEYAEFADAIEQLHARIQAGAPDFATFVRQVEEVVATDPAGLRTVGDEILNAGEDAFRAAANVQTAQQAVNALGDAAAGRIGDLAAFSNALERLAGIALPALSQIEQAEAAFGDALSAGGGNLRRLRDADDALVGAMGRIANQQAGAAVPTPTPRPNDIQRLDWEAEARDRIARSAGRQADAYDNLVRGTRARIEQLQLEERLIGTTGIAAAQLRLELELMQQAQGKGRSVSAEQQAELKGLAAEYGEVARRVAELRALEELGFEREQIGRSQTEQRVYGELRQIGLDINTIEGKRVADAIRLNERLVAQRELAEEVAGIFAGMFSTPLAAGETFFDRMMASAAQLGQAIQQSGAFGKAGGAIGAGVGGLGAGFGAQDPILGALGGGLSGFMSGGITGGIVGLIGGIVGGIIGQDKKRREEAAAMAKALEDLGVRMLRVTTATDTLQGSLAVFDAQATLEVRRLREARASAEVIVRTEQALAAERLAIVRDFEKQRMDAARQALDGARSTLQAVYDREAGSIRGLIEAHRNAVESFEAFRNRIRLDTNITPLDPGRRLAEAERQFNDLAARYEGGDTDVVGALEAAGQRWIEEAMSYHAATVEGFAVFHTVDERMAQLVDGSQRQMTEQERQLAALDAQVLHLTGIESGVLTLAQALTAFHEANAAVQAAQLAYDDAQLAVAQQQAAALQQIAANQNNAPGQAMPSLLERALNTGGSSQGFFDRIFNWQPGFALGGAFDRGVQRFAQGGIVNRPTLFPMANGAGLMGEAGPEAIMPLRRGPDGRLGVSAPAGGSSNDNGALLELARAQDDGTRAIVAAIGRLEQRLAQMEENEASRAREAAKLKRAS